MKGHTYIVNSSHKKRIAPHIIHKKSELIICKDGTHNLFCQDFDYIFHIETAPSIRDGGKSEILFLDDHIQFLNVRCWPIDYSWGDLDHSRDITEISFQFWPKGSKPKSDYSLDDFLGTNDEIVESYYH